MLELIDYNFYTNNFEGISIPSNSFKNIVIKAIMILFFCSPQLHNRL